MLLKKIQISLFALVVSAIFASCSLPTAVVKAPSKAKEEFTVGSYKIITSESTDSVQNFFKYRYYPVFHFAVVDGSGNVTERYVGAWQEYLSRFAGELRTSQKAYLQGYPLFSPLSNDELLSWRFPVFEGEVSDLKNVEPIRVSYWSLDKITGEESSEEMLILSMLSVPQPEPLKADRKLAPEYRENILRASAGIYDQMKKFLILELQRRQAAE